MPKKQRPAHHMIYSNPRRELEISDGVAEAADLVRRKHWTEARQRLEALDQRYPNQVVVLQALLELYLELHDNPAFQATAERLVQRTPDDPAAVLSLAAAYTMNLRPALTVRTFRRFLDHWPTHPEAPEIRKSLAGLEAQLPSLLRDLGVAGEEGLAIAILHEEMQSLVEAGDFRQAYKVAERLEQQHPNFPPMLNNLSLAYALDGRIERAITTAERVLAIDPDNYHALANLVRYRVLTGRRDEAVIWAARLKTVTAAAPAIWTKKAEALSFLGDDQGVLDAYQGAKAAGWLKAPHGDPLLSHLGAVAAWRLGRQAEARRYWQQALRRAPGFELAEANLADLRRPVAERHAPWPFSLNYWLNQQAMAGLRQLAAAVARRPEDDTIAGRATRRFLHQQPEIVTLVPLLLERGDPIGREFAFNIARWAGTPEMLAALHDFALDPWGPDQMRVQAAQIAVEAGLFPSGPVTLWQNGEERGLLLMGFEITGEPTVAHGPAVTELGGAALAAFRQGDHATAERLWQQALAIEPDAPDLQNNLALAYQLQGRHDEALALADQIRREHPDYAFAQITAVRRLIQQNDLAAARPILDALMTRRRFHMSEFAALCNAQIDYILAENRPEALDAAQGWLDIWESVDPENPALPNRQLLVNIQRLQAGLGRRQKRHPRRETAAPAE